MKWKKIIDENCDNDNQNRPIPSLLVQNKTDLIDASTVKEFQKKSHLDEFASKNGFCGVCCTSAKDNKNIEECFQQLLGNT
jgi:GTPase SAR1 family protein